MIAHTLSVTTVHRTRSLKPADAFVGLPAMTTEPLAASSAAHSTDRGRMPAG